MDQEEAQMEAAKKMILNRILDKNALERLGRIKAANPVLANNVEMYIIQLFQAGKLNDTITDEQLRQMLNVLTEKRETKIKRR